MRVLVAFSMLVLAANAKVATFTACEETEENVQSQCTISEVRIEPCKLVNNQCKLKRGGEPATVSFDFTPNFPATKLKNSVVWDGIQRVPWQDLELDGCKATTCPLTPGVNQTYTYNLRIGKRYPKGTYPVIWKVSNEEDESKACCFRTTIRIY